MGGFIFFEKCSPPSPRLRRMLPLSLKLQKGEAILQTKNPGSTGIFVQNWQASRGNRTPGASLENWGITTIRYSQQSNFT